MGIFGQWNRDQWVSGLGMVFQASSGTAGLITFFMEVYMLARLEEKRIRAEGLKQGLVQGREQGQQENQQRWVDWNNRREAHARTSNEPFNEPPPSQASS